MATTYKVLGQVTSAASSANVLLYPISAYSAGTSQTIGSTLTVCNQGSSAATYSISVKVNTSTTTLTAPVAKEYLAYQVVIPANTTTSYTLGITLDPFDHVVVSASTTTVSFNLFGTEIA